MNKGTSFLPCLTLTLIAGSILLVAIIGFLGLVYLQNEVERTFGEAHPSIDYAQKLRLQLILFMNKDVLLKPLNPQGNVQSFVITANEPTQAILSRLSQEGLISNPKAMQALMVYLGYDLQILTGEHLLTPAMSPVQIAEALTDPTNLLVPFNLLAGWRNEEIAEALKASGLRFSTQAFLDAANQPLSTYLSHRQGLDSIDNLQGFLLPDTYRIQKTASAADLLRLFTKNFDVHVTAEIEQKFQQQGLTLYNGIILASIVQRESVLEEEMPLIASVFLNRLRADMKLDADSTVQFAIGFNPKQNTWWTNPLSTTNFAIDSPYNTYLYKGLPPTPICNPSIQAIQAVANAPKSDYFYFRAACDGSGRHLFAKTYAEHMENSCP